MTRRHPSHVRPARWLVLVPVLALVASSVIAMASAPVSAGTARAPGSAASSRARHRGQLPRPSGGGLSRLPLAARGVVSQTLGDAEPAYRISEGRGGFQAAGPAHAFSARFGPRGSVVISTRQGSVSLRPAGLGYGAMFDPLRLGAGVARTNRLSYGDHTLSMWYANGPLGLEQGFMLRAPPPGRRAGPLTLGLALGGSLRPRLERGGVSLLGAGGGVALRYQGLVATDARGRPVHAWMALHGGFLLVRVADGHATYPLRIDPFLQQQKLIPSGETCGPTTCTQGGWSVALSADGSTALIGGPGDNQGVGAAWVYTRSSTTWVEEQKLVPGDETGGPCGQPHEPDCSSFGTSVALSAGGSTALIGGPSDDADPQGFGSGAAWVYTRSGTTFSEQQKLVPSDEACTPPPGPGYYTTCSSFGTSVALSGDGTTALIGGPLDDPYGAAWVYTRSGTTFSEQQKLTPSDATNYPAFGTSVALSADGTTALIGGPYDGGYESVWEGAAWVFTRSGTTWSQQGLTLTPVDEMGKGLFGSSVALSADGTTALIGGWADAAAVGAAWVFTRSGPNWLQQDAKLTPSDEIGDAVNFGQSVALSGDGNTALIGGQGDNYGVGAAWVYTRSGNRWSQQQKLVPSDDAGSAFGQSVGLSSDAGTALIGGPGDASGLGAAWVFGAPCQAGAASAASAGAVSSSVLHTAAAITSSSSTSACQLNVAVTPLDLKTSPVTQAAGVLSGVSWQGRGGKAGLFSSTLPSPDSHLGPRAWTNNWSTGFVFTCISGCTNVVVAASDVNGKAAANATVTASLSPLRHASRHVVVGSGYLCAMVERLNSYMETTQGRCGQTVTTKTDSHGLALLRYYAPAVVVDENAVAQGTASYPRTTITTTVQAPPSCNGLACSSGAKGQDSQTLTILPHDIYQDLPIGGSGHGVVLSAKDRKFLAAWWKVWTHPSIVGNRVGAIGALALAWFLKTFRIVPEGFLRGDEKELVNQIIGAIVTYPIKVPEISQLVTNNPVFDEFTHYIDKYFGLQTFSGEAVRKFVKALAGSIGVDPGSYNHTPHYMTVKLYEASICETGYLCRHADRLGHLHLNEELFATFSTDSWYKGISSTTVYRQFHVFGNSYNISTWIPKQCHSSAGCTDPYKSASLP